MVVKSTKKRIEANFSRASTTYDSFARMQNQAADLLLTHVGLACASLQKGTILEIGCGTGQMSAEISRLLGSRKLIFSDISVRMVEQCQQKIEKLRTPPNDFQCTILDAEQLSDKNAYAAVISGLTVQWFSDFQQTLHRVYDSLIPGGEFIFSCLVQGSFAQWYSASNRLNVPCTANLLPNSAKINQEVATVFDSLESVSKSIEIEYPSTDYFFRSLKLTGTNAQKDGLVLTAGQMRRLIRGWELSLKGETLKMTYVFDILRAKKKR
nr:methyltransferase domain-containing protein [Desulfobulbaceae bacterium]